MGRLHGLCCSGNRTRVPPAQTGRGARRPVLAAAAAAGLLAGCIVVPRTTEVYDPQCRTFNKQVVLEVEVVAQLGHCHNDGCVALLVSAGIISAATAVVAGSVAVVGNIAYWLERRGQCAAPAAAPAPPPASAPA